MLPIFVISVAVYGLFIFLLLLVLLRKRHTVDYRHWELSFRVTRWRKIEVEIERDKWGEGSNSSDGNGAKNSSHFLCFFPTIRFRFC